MRLLGVDGPTFPELFTASRDAMKDAYPVVAEDWQRISQYAYAEEETFLRTLASGSTILDLAVEDTKRSRRHRASRPPRRSSCTTPTGSRST